MPALILTLKSYLNSIKSKWRKSCKMELWSSLNCLSISRSILSSPIWLFSWISFAIYLSYYCCTVSSLLSDMSLIALSIRLIKTILCFIISKSLFFEFWSNPFLVLFSLITVVNLLSIKATFFSSYFIILAFGRFSRHLSTD